MRFLLFITNLVIFSNKTYVNLFVSQRVALVFVLLTIKSTKALAIVKSSIKKVTFAFLKDYFAAKL